MYQNSWVVKAGTTTIHTVFSPHCLCWDKVSHTACLEKAAVCGKANAGLGRHMWWKACLHKGRKEQEEGMKASQEDFLQHSFKPSGFSPQHNSQPAKDSLLP